MMIAEKTTQVRSLTMDNKSMNYLKILTTCILTACSKKKDVFSYLHNKNYNIFPCNIHILYKRMRKWYKHHGVLKLTLVHIDQIPVEWPFFKTNFEFKVNDAFSDTYCDSVTLDVTIDNENYLQVNVYRPNEENPQFHKDIS